MEISMLTHPTHERLIALGLTGMAKALEEQRRSSDLDALSFEERVGLLVDREAAERDTKRLTTRLKFAALRQSACVEDVDLRTPRGIDRAIFARLVGGDWIDRNENLLVTGATFSRSSMIATVAPRPSSPARSPSNTGTTSSAIQPSATPSWTVSFTTLTAFSLPEKACERRTPAIKLLTPPQTPEPITMSVE